MRRLLCGGAASPSLVPRVVPLSARLLLLPLVCGPHRFGEIGVEPVDCRLRGRVGAVHAEVRRGLVVAGVLSVLHQCRRLVPGYVLAGTTLGGGVAPCRCGTKSGPPLLVPSGERPDEGPVSQPPAAECGLGFSVGDAFAPLGRLGRHGATGPAIEHRPRRPAAGWRLPP